MPKFIAFRLRNPHSRWHIAYAPKTKMHICKPMRGLCGTGLWADEWQTFDRELLGNSWCKTCAKIEVQRTETRKHD